MAKMRTLLTLGGALLATPAFAQDATANSGDTAWMLTSALLVLMMSIPGLALFYGGLVKRDNVLATLMQTFVIVCLISILWPVVGYTLSFSSGNEFFGDFSKVMLQGVTASSLSGTIPESVFIMFQMTFAAITTALLVGSVADRIKFSAVILLSGLWVLLVYAPVAHWVWGPGGLLGGAGVEGFAGIGGFGAALDYAGGTVVHVNSGVAGLVAALVLGRGINFQQHQSTSNNLVMSVIGAGLLWVGWFGFNAGSALTAGNNAGMAMLVTNTAAAMAGLSWLFVEWMTKGKPTVAGALSGMVSGLVAVTPGSGFVDFQGALAIGFAAGIVCYWACFELKKKLKYDDSLDVFGIHGVGGTLGAILTGVFATKDINPLGSGWIDGNSNQVIAQIIGVVVVAVYSGVVTYIILKVVNMITGLRVAPDVEQAGLDLALHGEQYNR